MCHPEEIGDRPGELRLKTQRRDFTADSHTEKEQPGALGEVAPYRSPVHTESQAGVGGGGVGREVILFGGRVSSLCKALGLGPQICITETKQNSGKHACLTHYSVLLGILLSSHCGILPGERL